MQFQKVHVSIVRSIRHVSLVRDWHRARGTRDLPEFSDFVPNERAGDSADLSISEASKCCVIMSDQALNADRPREARWRRGRRSGVVTHFDDAEVALGSPCIGPRSGRRRLGLLQLLFAQRPATAYFAMTNRGVIAKEANRRSNADNNYRELGHTD